jgi:hypothetical protein
MTGSLDPHEPTPEFRAHLAWQLESALRRQSRLAAPVSRGQTLRIAALVVVALAVGGAAGVAAGHVQDAKQRNSLLQNVQSEEQLVRTRLELARAEYDEVRRRYEIGTAGRESLLVAEQQLRAMEAALERLRLVVQEIQTTSAVPRDDLTAPLAGGRDFVRDRLLLELQAAQRALAAAEERAAEARRQVEIGVAKPAAQMEAAATLARLRAELQLLHKKVQLRERFVRSDIEAEALAAELRRTELLLGIERAQRQIALSRERLNLLRRQAEVGMSGQLEVKRAELAVLEAEVELQQMQRELAALSPRAK